jgi:hypothetical protein
MLGVTLFGIFLTPVFYYVIQWFGDWSASRRRSELDEEEESEEAPYRQPPRTDDDAPDVTIRTEPHH